MGKEHSINNTKTDQNGAMIEEQYIIYKLSKAGTGIDVYFFYSVIEVSKDAVYLFGTSFFKDMTDYKKLSHRSFNFKGSHKSVNLNFG